MSACGDTAFNIYALLGKHATFILSNNEVCHPVVKPATTHPGRSAQSINKNWYTGLFTLAENSKSDSEAPTSFKIAFTRSRRTGEKAGFNVVATKTLNLVALQNQDFSFNDGATPTTTSRNRGK